jgi:DNA-binding transcriptional MerR regulator
MLFYQEVGFSLDEIWELLTAGGAGERRRVRDHLKVQLAELDERVRLMRNFRKTLARHLAACERELKRHTGNAVCPALVTISGSEKQKKR